MKARRLFCLLLIALLALPLAAPALAMDVPSVQNIQVFFQGTEPNPETGLPQEEEAFFGIDFTWETDALQGGVWIEPKVTERNIPWNSVRVVVTLATGMDTAEYVLVDSMWQSEWIDLSAYMLTPMSNFFELRSVETNEPAGTFTLSTSPTLNADPNGQEGSGEGDYSGEINLPGVGESSDDNPFAGGEGDFGNGSNFPEGGSYGEGNLGGNGDDIGGGNEPPIDNPESGSGAPVVDDPIISSLAMMASQGSPDVEPPTPTEDLEKLPDAIESNYAYVDELNAFVYLTPSASGQPIATLNTNQKAEAIVQYDLEDGREALKDEEGRMMVPVKFKDENGQEIKGYIRVVNITFMNEEQGRLYAESIKPPKDTLPEHYSNFLYITGDSGATMQTLAGTLFALNKGDAVYYEYDRINNTKYDENDQLLVLVTDQKTQTMGYVPMKSMQFMTTQDEKDYRESLITKDPMPEHTNNYADVTTHGAFLYDGSMKTQLRALLTTDVVVYTPSISTQHNELGEIFIPVTVDDGSGAVGYVKGKEITFMTNTRYEAYKKEKEPVPEMPSSPRHAWVVMNDTQVRPNPNSAAQYLLQKDAVVKVTSLTQDTNGVYWYYVEMVSSNKGSMGYIRADLLKLMTESEERLYLESIKPEEKPPEVNYPTLTQQPGYMRVNTAYAPLLSWPDLGANITRVLNANEVVYVHSQEYDAQGNVWSYTLPLTAGASWGYVQHKYLLPMSSSEINNYFATPRPTPTVAPTYAPGTFSGYAMLTSNQVNFRSSAASANNNNVIRRLAQGTIVRVISEVSAEGYTWYYVESNGTLGYVRSDMMSLLTIREYQLVVTSPSYDKNGTIITPTATANAGNISVPTWTQKPNATSTITFVTLPPSTSTPVPSASPDPSASVDPSASASASADASGLPGAIGGVTSTPSPDPNATLPPDGEFPTQESSGFSPPGLLTALAALLVLGGGGLYGYSVYNKSRRKQAQTQAQREAAAAKKAESSSNPAIRRPTPAVPPTAGQTKPSSGQQTPGQGQPKPGTTQSPAARQPGQPTSQPQTPGTRPGTPAPGSTAQGTNPYARPQSAQPRTQDVNSPLPRAQVDGRPVSGTQQPNPYARPEGAGQQPTRPADGTRLPVAPPPVTPDASTTAPTGEDAVPRRRRRRQDINGDNGNGTPPTQE